MKKMLFLVLCVFSQISYGQGAPSQSSSADTQVSPRMDEVIKWSDALDLHAWNNYADSLKDCKPNTFTLINPLSIGGAIMAATMEPAAQSRKQDEFTKRIIDKSMTYQIIGLQGDKCLVKMNMPEDTDIPPEMGSAKTLNCSISQSDLATVSQAAKIIASHNIKDADSNGAADAASATILAKACVKGV